MFIGPCIIVIVEELETNLMSLIKFITLNICSTCFEHPVVLQPAKRTLPNIIRCKPQHTTITEQGNDVVNRRYSRKLLKMDILMFETC